MTTLLEALQQQQEANQRTSLGNIQQAQALESFLRAAQDRKMMEGVNTSTMTPDQLDILGQRLASAGHPGAAAVMTIADKRRKQVEETSTLSAMRGTAGIQPDPQELAQAQDQGTPPPQATAQGGLFAPLIQSQIPYVANTARAYQQQMTQYPNVSSAYWQKAFDALHKQETDAIQKQGSGRPVAVIGPDGKPVYVSSDKAVGQRPYSPSIAGAGEFSPDALRMVAEQYLSGDRQAIQGYARNATAKIALQNEITKLAKERGWSGNDIAAQMADFAGVMSGARTVGTRAANIELAASEAEKMIDIVLEKSKGFERTQFVPLNIALKAFEKNTGQPEVKAFGAAINALVNVYGRAISPSGVPTVADKEHAREMLASVDSPEQVQAVMDVMRQEMKAARSAPGEVSAARRNLLSPKPTDRQGAPATTAGAIPQTNAKGWALHVDAKGNRAYVSPDGKSFEEVK